MIIGLDVVGYQLVRGADDVKNLERLARALETGGFTALRQIYVRIEPPDGFEEAARTIRGIFPENLLTVDNVPSEGNYTVWDMVEDCWQYQGGSGRAPDPDPLVPFHQHRSVSYYTPGPFGMS